MYRAFLHRYAVVVACSTLLLLVAGGLVTSNHTGLAVASWPQFEMESVSPGARYEVAHRVAAAVVGLLTLGLAAALLALERRAWLRRLGLAAVAAVVGQALLGGLGVRWLLPQAVSVAHAVLASLFFALTVAIAVFTSKGWIEHPRTVASEGRIPLRALSLVAAAAVLAQIGMGAAMRHNALGLAPHIAAGAAAAVLGLWAVWLVLSRHVGHAGLRRSALALLSLGASQAVLGMGTYLGGAVLAEAPQAPPRLVLAFSVSHVAAGAGTLAAAVALAIYARRRVSAVMEEAA